MLLINLNECCPFSIPTRLVFGVRREILQPNTAVITPRAYCRKARGQSVVTAQIIPQDGQMLLIGGRFVEHCLSQQPDRAAGPRLTQYKEAAIDSLTAQPLLHNPAKLL